MSSRLVLLVLSFLVICSFVNGTRIVKKQKIIVYDSEEDYVVTAPVGVVANAPEHMEISEEQALESNPYYPYILRRRRNLKACEEWDFEAAIQKQIEWERQNPVEQSKPVVFSDSDSEEQVAAKASQNVIARLMTKYRHELGFVPGQVIDEGNEEESNFFLFLNWDFLDLTRFNRHEFPINKIMISTGLDGPLPEFRPVGLEIIKAHFDNIHFHNPRSIEGRRMLLFQRLYRRYEKVMGRFDPPNYIDWTNCKVSNWPSYVSRSDLTSWNNQDISAINDLLEANIIKFTYKAKANTEKIEPLGKDEVAIRPVTVDYAAFTGEMCGLSDSREVCGVLREATAAPMKESEAKKSNNKKKLEAEPKKIKKESSSPNKGKKRLRRKSSSSSEDDNSSLSSSSSPSGSELPAIQEPSLPTKFTGQRMNKLGIKSDLPADPAQRKKVLQAALDAFRDQTRQPNATKIDWSLLNVTLLQNHLIPFSLDFKTEGDIATLENLIKKKKLLFLNMNTLSSRRVRVYERLYRIYSNQVCKYFNVAVQDAFFVRWNDIELEGWPEGMATTYGSLKASDLDILEPLFEANRIKVRLNPKFIALVTGDRRVKEIYESQFESTSSEDSSDNSSSNDHSSSPGSSVVSEDSTVADVELLQKEAIGGLLRSRAVPVPRSSDPLANQTPKFSSFIQTDAGSSPKSLVKMISRQESEKVLSVFDEEAEEEKIKISSNSSFPQITVQQQRSLLETINSSFEAFSALQANYSSESSRHYRIITEILRCLDLLRQHAQNTGTARVLVSISDLNEFMKIFNNSLSVISPDSSMTPGDLKTFICAAVRLRARLLGIGLNIPMNRNFRIPKANIAFPFLFSFLSQSESNWTEIGLIELYLFTEGYDLFKDSDK